MTNASTEVDDTGQAVGAVGSTPPRLAERIAPGVFVLLWSSGFVAAHYSTGDAGPFTFLTVRFVLAAAVLWSLALLTKAPSISRESARWAAITAVGLHALYLGGVFFAISKGLPAGLSALIAGLHPVLTSIGGHFVLRERLRRVQVVGIAIGVGGVLFVVVDELSTGAHGVTGVSLVAMGFAVLGVTGGTLVQRARGTTMPLVRGTAMQYTVTALVFAPVALLHEHWRITFTAREIFSLGWAVILLSMGSVLIMLWLLQRQEASRVTSLFFLTPAFSAIEGAILLGERLGALAIVGLVISLAGVALTTR